MKRCNSIKKITDNPFLNLYHIDARSKSGKEFDYYFASRNDEQTIKAVKNHNDPEGISVYALCKDNPGLLVMIRQFRYPLNDYIYEIPAGLVDADETPTESAIREMKEETGLNLEVYEGGDSCFRNPFFLAQGMTDESGVMVYGYVTGEICDQGLEDGEDIEVLLVDRVMAREILQKSKVSVRAAYMLMNFIHSKDSKPFAFLDWIT